MARKQDAGMVREPAASPAAPHKSNILTESPPAPEFRVILDLLEPFPPFAPSRHPMFKTFLSVAVALGLVAGALAAQQSPISPKQVPSPVSSPEPITMLALAGGAAAAGGLAYRRRKSK